MEIKSKENIKDLEIYDIYGPSKSGFKFNNFQNDKIFAIIPFYKISKLKKIIFWNKKYQKQ